MRVGAGSFTYSWWAIRQAEAGASPEKIVFELLEKVQSRGFKLIQICDNVPVAALTPRQLEELGGRCAASGVELQIGTRGVAVEHLEATLEKALRSGAGFVRTMLIDLGGREAPAEECIDQLRRMAPAFERAKVALGIENHDGRTTRQLADVLRAVDSPAVGACVDTVNSFAALEAPDQVIRNLGPFAKNLHLKDFTVRRVNRGMGFAIEGAPVGDGRLDLKLLGRVAPGADAIIEFWPPFQGDLEATVRLEEAWVGRSLENLERLGWIQSLGGGA